MEPNLPVQKNHGILTFSVYFSLDTSVPTNAIIEAFDSASVDYDDILSVQRRLSSNAWIVAFRTAAAKEHVLSAWNFVIAGHRVFIADCDRKISLVKIYNAPNEMPDSVIIGRLSVYGSVLSFRRDLLTDSIFNGVRTARMEVKKEIPSTVRIAGEFIRFWYPGQPKTCRHCGDLGHLIKECQSVRCFNCEESGHRSEECEMPPLCSICRSIDHVVCECPYFCFSANVSVPAQSVQNASTSSSYAGAAKAPRTVVFQSVLPAVVTRPSGDQGEKVKEKEKQAEKTKEKRGASEPSRESSRRSSERGRESRERDGRGGARDRGRERDLERERDRERDHERDRERERERERYRDRSHHHRHDRSRDDDRHRSKDHDRERSHQSHGRSSESYDSEGWTEVRHRSRDKYYY